MVCLGGGHTLELPWDRPPSPGYTVASGLRGGVLTFPSRLFVVTQRAVTYVESHVIALFLVLIQQLLFKGTGKVGW